MSKLIWSETEEPNEFCRYQHTYSQTPFGLILITWKGWKEYHSYDIEDFPGCYSEYRDGIISLSSSNTESAKIEAEEKYFEWLVESHGDAHEMIDNICLEMTKYMENKND